MHYIKNLLVVVADSVEAKFYISHDLKNLDKIHEIQHPEGHYKERDFTSKEHDRNSILYDDKNNKKIVAKHNFAAQIMLKAQALLEKEDLHDICIFAPFKFILPKDKEKISKHFNLIEINKDLTNSEPSEVVAALQAAFDS
jgi:protein required for attachment to host cells